MHLRQCRANATRVFTMPVNKHDLAQMRGAGVGSFFSNMYTELVPMGHKAVDLTKRVLESETGKAIADAAKRRVVDAGITVSEAALRGQNVKEVAKEEIRAASKGIVQDAVEVGKMRQAKRVAKKRGGKKKAAPKSKKLGAGRGKTKRVGRKRGGKKKGGKKGKKNLNALMRDWGV